MAVMSPHESFFSSFTSSFSSSSGASASSKIAHSLDMWQHELRVLLRPVPSGNSSMAVVKAS